MQLHAGDGAPQQDQHAAAQPPGSPVPRACSATPNSPMNGMLAACRDRGRGRRLGVAPLSGAGRSGAQGSRARRGARPHLNPPAPRTHARFGHAAGSEDSGHHCCVDTGRVVEGDDRPARVRWGRARVASWGAQGRPGQGRRGVARSACTHWARGGSCAAERARQPHAAAARLHASPAARLCQPVMGIQ